MTDNNESIKAIIDLDVYQIAFMPDYTGFLYIEADSGEIDVQNIGKITFKDNLTKFYIEKNSYVIIHNPINLRSVKFVEFAKQEDCNQLNITLPEGENIIDELINKFNKTKE